MAYRVDAKVPFGNACDASVTDDAGAVTVEFASDPHGGPECLWFCFRLEPDGDQTGIRRGRLLWRHFGNTLGGNDPACIQPVMRRTGGDWHRLEPGAAEPLPDGRQTATWTIDAPAEPVDLALCYPYGPDDVEALVDQTGGYFRCDTIAVSQGARPIWRLSNDYGQAGDDRPGLFLIARQHSGETPGSWVLDGFLRAIADGGSASPLVWAVPLSNIDGVVQGDYGKDNFPYDLNRAWDSPPMRHETLAIQRDFKRWYDRCKPVMAIDFHAPGACETDGAYFYVPNPDRFETVGKLARTWGEQFGKAIGPEYSAPECARVATYRSRWETPGFATYCADQWDLCALSMETPYSRIGDTVLTRERYRQIGDRMARCLIERLAR